VTQDHVKSHLIAGWQQASVVDGVSTL